MRTDAGSALAAAFSRRSRWHPGEIALWIAVAALAAIFDTHLVLASQILITALFALSLDLLLGYGGMISLGHAAYFGLGGFVAGILATHGWTEPLSGLAAGTLAAALLGYLVGFALVRLTGLALLMVTMGLGLLLFEIASDFSDITGGTDGLNISMSPLLGLFDFDLYGRTQFVYAFVVTLAGFAFVRLIVTSPFGLSLQGWRENPARMAQIGAPMAARLRTVNALAGGLAGLAGALLCQTTEFISVDALSFNRSAGVLIMLILGGGGRLYGGLVGATLYMIGSQVLAVATPEYWYFWLGLMLVLIVLFMPSGLLGGAALLLARWRRDARPMTAALSTRGLSRSFGALAVARAIDFALPAGARHALIGPNGAGKTTFINLLTGALRPSAGQVTLGETDITALPTWRRVRLGLARTFQINSLFPDFTPLETLTMTVLERDGAGGRLFTGLRRHAAQAEEAFALLAALNLADDATRPTRDLPYGRQRLLEIGIALALKPRVLLLDEPAAGVPAGESRELFEAIAALPPDIAILFIEHDMDLVFRFAQRITVLVAGQVLCEGAPAEIAADPRVHEVYLGNRAVAEPG